MQQVVVYSPLEWILYRQGGFEIIAMLVVAAALALGVVIVLDRQLARLTVKSSRIGVIYFANKVQWNLGWVFTALMILFLIAGHFAYVYGIV